MHDVRTLSNLQIEVMVGHLKNIAPVLRSQRSSRHMNFSNRPKTGTVKVHDIYIYVLLNDRTQLSLGIFISDKVIFNKVFTSLSLQYIYLKVYAGKR